MIEASWQEPAIGLKSESANSKAGTGIGALKAAETRTLPRLRELCRTFAVTFVTFYATEAQECTLSKPILSYRL
jgi:hypothetical protein